MSKHQIYTTSSVTLHVSVWVEIKCWNSCDVATSHAPRERVSWNFKICKMHCISRSHAPRERVSWNLLKLYDNIYQKSHAPRERVSWNLCSRQNKSLSTGHAPRERVSWNIPATNSHNFSPCHAPRERVSWNLGDNSYLVFSLVTLHVSVWVEIGDYTMTMFNITSRSTWACELKLVSISCVSVLVRHAPRERVSWNILGGFRLENCICHAPRERVSWNQIC